MKKRNKQGKKLVARTLTAITNNMLSAAANSRCTLIYHQPKQPQNLKNFRKF